MNKAYIWLGRFVATAVLIYSAFLLVVTISNLIAGAGYESWLIVTWILTAAVVGLFASLVFLFTIDGPTRFQTKGYRRFSWWIMFLAILLPTTISFFLAPLTATTVGLSFQTPIPKPIGRHVKVG
jgi:hypothetical protein